MRPRLLTLILAIFSVSVCACGVPVGSSGTVTIEQLPSTTVISPAILLSKYSFYTYLVRGGKFVSFLTLSDVKTDNQAILTVLENEQAPSGYLNYIYGEKLYLSSTNQGYYIQVGTWFLQLNNLQQFYALGQLVLSLSQLNNTENFYLSVGSSPYIIYNLQNFAQLPPYTSQDFLSLIAN